MTRAAAPYLVAVVAALAATAFVLLVRLPSLFDGASVVIAGVLAFMATLAASMALPARLLWSDEARLRHAFSLRHGVTEARSGDVLKTILVAHNRADAMRNAAQHFADDLKARTLSLADHMDEVARQMFYEPDTLTAHRDVFVRSELVEEALRAHARLRPTRRASAPVQDQIQASRQNIAAALDALEQGFAEADRRQSNTILTEVEVASTTAEQLLNPGRLRAPRKE